jgi:signal transduction histidine kinase
MPKIYDDYRTNSHEELANFTEWNPNPIVELNRRGEIIYINMAAMVQFPTMLSAGHEHLVFLGLIEKMEEMLQGKNELVIYARDVTFSQNIYEQQVFAIPKKSSLFVYMSDITARRLAEDKINKFAKELELRVAERTAELWAVNNELRHATEVAVNLAKKSAEDNSAKSTFFAAMSHKIQKPLNEVIGMTELLFTTNLSEQQQEYLKTIRSSGELLLSVINEVLIFSRVESDHASIEYSDFNVRNLVNDTIAIGSTELSGKNIEIIAGIDSDVPKILKGDAVKISQLLNIFLSNAIKFTETGQININVKVHDISHAYFSLDSSQKILTILFEVVDTGKGISDEIRQHLFQPFAARENSMTRKYEGAGLGLAMSKRLIEMMGGSVTVESELEKGSKFSFKLPLKVCGEL